MRGWGEKQMNERVTVIEEDKAGDLARSKDSNEDQFGGLSRMDGLLKLLRSRASTSRGVSCAQKNSQNNVSQ